MRLKGRHEGGYICHDTGTADQVLRALDQQSGKELWSVGLPAGAQSTPSVYRGKDGREYVW